MNPLDRYHSDIASGKTSRDSAQLLVLEKLSELQKEIDCLPEYSPAWWQRFLGSLTARDQREHSVKGLYLWGGVGRGKTYLVDLFYSCVADDRKIRTHFHRFMQRIHARLAVLQGEANPLEIIADELSQQARLLCFDEFFVSDIADAMLLGGLLTALFERGVILVATSNVPPEKLYENGLQREKFLPAIAAIQSHTRVHEISAGQDYRLERLSNTELYLHPIDSTTDQKLQQNFADLAPDQQVMEQDAVLTILDRGLRVRRMAEDVVWFEFSELCGGPRSAFDYVEIAKLFHAIILSNVPAMDDTLNDQARRFISLIDELYDRRVKLIVAAAVDVSALYTGQQLAFEFERTQSRLIEMQSHDYLCREHLA
jgi:cell division protein ZapE